MNKRRRFKAKRRRRMERWRRRFLLDAQLAAIVDDYARSVVRPEYVADIFFGPRAVCRDLIFQYTGP